MYKFDLVIFDCDGVLVDSEKIANEVFCRVLNEECGFSLSLEDMFERFVGKSSSQCMILIEEMLGYKPPFELEYKYKTEIFNALKSQVEAVKGIEHVLSHLNLPMCVASSGSHEKMQATLGKTGLLKYFGKNLTSGSDVKRGKPYPDIYIHAASKMGICDVSKCLVIEDSPTGVLGAIRADMSVFGYCELTKKQKLIDAGAHQTFDDMNQLLSMIKHF